VREAIAERRMPELAPQRASATDSTERVEVLFEQLAVMRTASVRFRM
jgi:hypothetical protein